MALQLTAIGDDDIDLWASVGRGRFLIDPVEDVHALHDLPEHDVLSVELGEVIRQREEELRRV
jgi:hypothetical protein